MSKVQDLIDVLEGRTPRRTPCTILDWNMERATTRGALRTRVQDDRWRRLLDRGLTIRHHAATVRAIEHGVDCKVEERKDGANTIRMEIKTTPVGSVSRGMRDGWHCKHWIETPNDYRVMRWIVEHTELVPAYDSYDHAEQVVGEHGFVALTGHGQWLHRTPWMTLNIDYAGTEQFCLDLAMEVPELFELCEAQRRLFLDEQRLIAAGPGRYVAWYENLNANMLGPDRYATLLMPVYEEAVAIHEAAGKRVMVHYDGATQVLADQIAKAPFHILDSLTEPPEGDLPYEDCRRLWPDKVLLANLSMGLYELAPEALRRAVLDIRERAGKHAMGVGISEELPENWQASIPILLETLAELD